MASILARRLGAQRLAFATTAASLRHLAARPVQVALIAGILALPLAAPGTVFAAAGASHFAAAHTASAARGAHPLGCGAIAAGCD